MRQLLIKLREHGHTVEEAKYDDVEDAAFGAKEDGEAGRSERALARYIRDRYHGRVEGGVDGLCSAYDAAIGEIERLKQEVRRAQLKALDGLTLWELERQEMLSKLMHLSMGMAEMDYAPETWTLKKTARVQQLCITNEQGVQTTIKICACTISQMYEM